MRYFIFSVCFAVLISGCGGNQDGGTSNPGQDVLAKYAFQAEGAPVITSAILPTDFTEPSWSQKSTVCRDAGYDLAPHAGQNVSLIRYTVKEKYGYHGFIYVYSEQGSMGPQEVTGELPLYLWVVVSGQETVCGYLSASDPNTEYLSLLHMGFFPSQFIAVNDEHII
ncbi:DUF4830 domain-containing protein [Geomonas ferrireducens]|uniref:DUF4830 domain-containing protein n=1 Tax=Geomonas ferrireducens TaxID=2570227 RepID=UPI0010A7ACB3|nr:DUF4830 domain-containing protein [Geomonas ferrireducens]